MLRTVKNWIACGMAFGLIAGISQAAQTPGRTHMIATLIPARSVLPLGAFDMSTLHYAVQEFSLSGDAVSYRAAASPSEDGRWNVEVDQHAPFTTRLVVVRAENPANFNGTVIV